MVRALLIVATLCMAASLAHGATTKQLSPFTSVQVCTPFNVAIAPSKGNQYSLTVDGDSAVAPAVIPTVSQGVLSLGSKGSFSSTKPIKITVSLPASKLTAVTAGGAAGVTVVVDSGFSVSSLTGTVPGSGNLLFRNTKAGTVKLVNSGTGNLVFTGAATSASVQSAGTGTVYVSGVTGQVAVQGSGTSETLINSASNSLKITGAVSGIASLTYNKGACSVSGEDLGTPCQKGPVQAPSISAAWTCGVQHSGSFSCSTSGGSTSSQQSSSGNGGFSSGSTFSSGGGSSFSSSSSSSSGGGGTSFFSSSSDGSGSNNGQSTLTTNTGKLSSLQCSVSSGALKISRK